MARKPTESSGYVISFSEEPGSPNMISLLIFSSLLMSTFAAKWCCNPPTGRHAMLDVLVKDNDHDGDGFVSGADFNYDLSHNYDFNKDGKVSIWEWIKRWNCRYGDSLEYAEWVYTYITKTRDDIDIAAFPAPPAPGIPVAAFRATNLKRYTVFANLQKS